MYLLYQINAYKNKQGSQDRSFLLQHTNPKLKNASASVQHTPRRRDYTNLGSCFFARFLPTSPICSQAKPRVNVWKRFRHTQSQPHLSGLCFFSPWCTLSQKSSGYSFGKTKKNIKTSQGLRVFISNFLDIVIRIGGGEVLMGSRICG